MALRNKTRQFCREVGEFLGANNSATSQDLEEVTVDFTCSPCFGDKLQTQKASPLFTKKALCHCHTFGLFFQHILGCHVLSWGQRKTLAIGIYPLNKWRVYITGLTSKQPSILLAKRTVPHGVRYSDGKSLDTIHLWQKESLQNMENKNTIDYSNMLSVYNFQNHPIFFLYHARWSKRNVAMVGSQCPKKMILEMGKWHN